MQRLTGLAVLAFMAQAPAFAEGGGDAIRGKAYAVALCSSCHAVAEEDTSMAPPFRVMPLKITDGPALAQWLNTGHPLNTKVAERQAEDIIAYIAALKADMIK